MQNFSFFEVREGDAPKVIKAMNGQEYKGRRISTEMAQAGAGGDRERGDRDQSRRRSGGGRSFSNDSSRGSRSQKRGGRKPRY